MAMSSAAVSKAEYLKRYLSADANGDAAQKKPKRKKSKRNDGVKRVTIIDQDVSVPYQPSTHSKTTTASRRPVAAASSGSESDGDAPVVQLTNDLSTEVLKSAAKFKTDSWHTVPSTSENAPRGRQRHDSSDSDDARIVDPPAKARRRHDSGSEADLSPARRKSDDPTSDSDVSPPRRPGGDAQSDGSDQSPARRRPAGGGGESDSDLTPPRKRRRDKDDDSSPPRRRRGAEQSRERRPRSPEHVKAGDKRMSRTLDGKAAGLQTAESLRKEADSLRKRQDAAFSQLDDTVSGRNAETIVRDKVTGRKKNVAEDKEKEAAKAKKQAELQEKYEYWNKGVRQVKEHAERMKEQSMVMAEPLARYEGDERLESHLKEQELKEDPMLEYMRKRKMKKHGITQVVPKYSGPAPAPNRFGIWPGYRWDGVDRGNGFERKLMTARNTRRADEDDAYKFFSGAYE